MKKFFIMAVLSAMVATPAMAAVTIVGSKHDMIASGFALANNGAPTEVCIFCHTPHAAQTSEPLVQLWNNTAVAASGYYGDDPTIGGSKIDFPTSVALINATDARICLACHDGSVSEPINGPNIGEITTVGAPGVMSATASLGTMSNDHPIGMDLGPNSQTNPDLTPSGLHTITDIKINFGGVSPFFGSTDDSINIMYCASCHDVHDSDPAKTPFLRISNASSALCKACHNK